MIIYIENIQDTPGKLLELLSGISTHALLRLVYKNESHPYRQHL